MNETYTTKEHVADALRGKLHTVIFLMLCYVFLTTNFIILYLLFPQNINDKLKRTFVFNQKKDLPSINNLSVRGCRNNWLLFRNGMRHLSVTTDSHASIRTVGQAIFADIIFSRILRTFKKTAKISCSRIRF